MMDLLRFLAPEVGFNGGEVLGFPSVVDTYTIYHSTYQRCLC